MIKHLATGALISALTLGTTQALAYEAGDIILRAGIASLQPEEQPFGTLKTLGAGLSNNEQLGLTMSYMLNDHLAVGVLASTPFRHDITSNGSKIGETKLLPPTVSLEYFPLNNESALQPYAGIGLNYTTFFSEESSLGDLELDDSFGLALELGVDYKISERLVLNATIWHVDVDTDASLDGNNIGGINIDPWAYMVSVGYQF